MLKGHHTRVVKQQKLHKLYPNALAFKKKIKFLPHFKTKKLQGHDSFYVEAHSVHVCTDSSISLYTNYKPPNGGDYIFRSIRMQKGMLKLRDVAKEQDCKVHYRYGKFYLVLSERQRPKVRVRVPGGGEAIAAIDPGVRTPFTVYSPEGSVVEMGSNASTVLDKHQRRIVSTRDNLRAVRAQVFKDRCDHVGTLISDRKHKKRQRQCMRRARKKYHEANDKAARVVRDFHYKSAHYLLQRFQTILLPHTSSHRWRTGHKLHKSTKHRSMMLRHGMFAQRLVQTASQYTGSRIVRGSEAYTSKQCGACGQLNNKLGASKVFTCPSCGCTADRDIHAARNILLRFLK